MKLFLARCAIAFWCFMSDQAIAEEWIADKEGCKAINPYSLPGKSIIWSGSCLDGYAEGDGILQFFQKEKLVGRYEGHFAKGELSGSGSLTTASGSRYEGSFEKNKLSQGAWAYSDGRRYEGKFDDGRPSGRGAFTYNNGARYVSDFTEDPTSQDSFQAFLSECEFAAYPVDAGKSRERGRTMARFALSARGEVSDLEILFSSHSPRLDAAAVEFIKHCKFYPRSPANQTAVNVFNTIDWDFTGVNDNSEVVLYRAPVVYPKILRRSGNSGVVKVAATVTANGAIEDIEVLESAHPALERAAIQSFSQWRVKPATRSGQPITTRINQSIRFELQEKTEKQAPNIGYTPFSFPLRGEKNLPAEFQYDEPPKIKFVAPLVYPMDFLKRKIFGSAEVSVMVDPEGNVRQVKVLQATERSFGLATKAMISSWQFDPARKNGKPSWSVFKFTQDFDKSDREVDYDDATFRLLSDPANIRTLAELDAKPKALYRPVPAYPVEFRDKKITDTVVIEFYIDKTGAVHLPHILKAENEDLAWLAMTALLRWQFEPPRFKGQAVDAVVSVPIAFK